MHIRALSCCFVLVSTIPVAAQRQDDYFAGKTITFVNNFPPGGSSDLWTRFNARYIGKFIPGNPVVSVQNRGGAAGKIGYGWFATQAPADGFTIGMFGGAMPQVQALGDMPRELPSIADLSIIASVGDIDVFFARRAKLPDGVASLRKPVEPPFAVAYESEAAGKLLLAQFSLMGLTEGKHFKSVRGFPGGAEILLAMRRGEIDFDIARIGLFRQSVAPEIAAGNWMALYQSGVAMPGGVRRSSAVPQIPTFEEAFETTFGRKPEGPDVDFTRWNAGANGTSRFAALPRGTPARVKDILVDAWRRMAADPEFLQEMDRTLAISPDSMLFADAARDAIVKVLAGPGGNGGAK
jgi:tripartite-type tricarboxylate transporter receptor subunit TctC